MPKNTTLLILVLALVTGILIFIALTTKNLIKPPTTTDNRTVVPTEKPVVKTANVYFSPSTLNVTTTSTTSVDIMVDSGGAEVAGVQAELTYDPKAITNVAIVPATDASSFFGSGSTVLFNEVKKDLGRVSYAIAISPDQSAKGGSGKVATLTFQKSPTTTLTNTTINFDPKTLVTILNEDDSVLKETSPLTINF